MRLATEADRPLIEAFLGRYAETSLFPLSNLARFGMGGDHPRAMRFWIAGEGPDAVLGLTAGGMVLPQVPPRLAPQAGWALAGESVTGIIGEAAQVAALREALGLDEAVAELDGDDQLFALDLDRLRMPGTEGLHLVPWSEASRDLLLRWRAAYGRETLGWGKDAMARAEADVNLSLQTGQHRLLLRDGVPVGATGFNARVGDVVQVGGVWTPPELRGQGIARAAVALHLAEARSEGVRRAILFSANERAARVYTSLGFEEIGRFSLFILARPQEVRRG